MILHIVRRGEWNDAVARGSYAPASLRVEGFIHCSTPAQVIDTANRFYRGQRDLIVLGIEESRVTAEVRWEAPARPHGVGVRNLTPAPFPRTLTPGEDAVPSPAKRARVIRYFRDIEGKGNQKKRKREGISSGRGAPTAEPSPILSREITGEALDELFPHLYGELNVDAVVRVIELPCEGDGSFRLSRELQREGS